MMQLAAIVAAARPAPAQPDSAPAGTKLSKEQVTAAHAVVGLNFDDAQLDMMLPGVSRALGEYEKLLKIDVPLDTEPAYSFHPRLPGQQAKAGPARFPPSSPSTLAAPGSNEDIAFLPITRLAALLKARRVTSTQLTKLYLARLKQFAPKLNCVVTLTEEPQYARPGRPTPKSPPASTADHCTASPMA